MGNTVIADFGASWCKNCKKISPHVASLAELHDGRVTVLDVDIDDLEDLAVAHGVSSIPR
jgi:thioredoxin 1